MNYTPSTFKSPEATIEETPSFHRTQATLPEIAPELKATIARRELKYFVE